jgi:hypothetical protein
MRETDFVQGALVDYVPRAFQHTGAPMSKIAAPDPLAL